jgi:predicted Zn finger-like uncharacterized protein
MPLTIHCPSCKKQLRVTDDLLGKVVRCPSCKTTFTVAGESGEIQEEEVKEVPARRPKQAPHDEDDENDLDEEERPRKRLRRRQRGDESAAKAPAIALLIVAGLSLLLALVYDIGHFMARPEQVPVPQGIDPAQKGTFEAAFKASYYGTPVIVTIWPLLVLPGAIQMLRLQTYWLAMTSSIVALLPCSPGCALGLPFGIWAIVALLKPEVKDAFE